MTDLQETTVEQEFIPQSITSIPNWYTFGDVTVDLNELAAVKTWYYLTSPTVPNGVRFVLRNGVVLDTLKMSAEEAMRSYNKVLTKLNEFRK